MELYFHSSVCLPDYRNLYSDPLRAGRSGGYTPVGKRFSVPVQCGPGAHPAHIQWVPALFPRGKSAGAWRCPHTPLLASRLRISGTIPLFPHRGIHGPLQGQLHLSPPYASVTWY